MTQLIPLQPQTINGNAVETVSARELHELLKNKQDFSTCIKNRIEKYEFVENQDYVSLHKKMEREIGGTTRIEYFVSVGMANFHCPKLGRPPIPMNKMDKPIMSISLLKN